MAKLVGLRVRGEAGRSERTIAALSRAADRAGGVQPLRRRALSAARRRPARLRRPARPALGGRGARRGDRRGDRGPPAGDRSTLTVQNLGSRELGRWGALLRGQIFGLTGLGDRTTLAALQHRRHRRSSRRCRSATISGSAARASRSAASSPTPGRARTSASPLSTSTRRTLFATLEASYPFVRRQTRTLRGAVGLDIIDQDIDFNAHPARTATGCASPSRRLGFDALGLSPGDPRYTPAEPVWRLGLSAEVAPGSRPARRQRGLRPRRSPPASRPAWCRRPGSRAIRPRPCCAAPPMANGGRSPRLTFALDLRGQYSAHPLFSFEEFSAGNYTAGRGYDPGTLLGDSGIGLQAELRYGSADPDARPTSSPPSPISSSTMPGSGTRTGCSSSAGQELSSIGGGVRAAYGDRFRLDLLVAVPLDRAGLQTRTRRSAPPRLVHHPPVAMEIPMTVHAPLAAPAPRAADRLRARRALRRRPARLDAQAFNANPEDRRRHRRLRPRHARASRRSPSTARPRSSTGRPSPAIPIIFLPAGNTATFINGTSITDFAVLNRILTTDAGPLRRHLCSACSRISRSAPPRRAARSSSRARAGSSSARPRCSTSATSC